MHKFFELALHVKFVEMFVYVQVSISTPLTEIISKVCFTFKRKVKTFQIELSEFSKSENFKRKCKDSRKQRSFEIMFVLEGNVLKG